MWHVMLWQFKNKKKSYTNSVPLLTTKSKTSFQSFVLMIQQWEGPKPGCSSDRDLVALKE